MDIVDKLEEIYHKLELQDAVYIIDAINLIESLRNQLSTNTWISVEDKLPDEGQEIIGLNDENDAWNEIFDSAEPLGSMKYWMPLPPAPAHKES